MTRTTRVVLLVGVVAVVAFTVTVFTWGALNATSRTTVKTCTSTPTSTVCETRTQ